MSKRPADVDIKQSIRDIFFTKNEYRLVDRECGRIHTIRRVTDIYNIP